MIDGDNLIIAGHGRAKAARIMNLTTLPGIRLTYLTSAQQRAYRLADNKITLNSGWNEDLLKMEISDLELMCDIFNITDTDFETLEIDALFAKKANKKLMKS